MSIALVAYLVIGPLAWLGLSVLALFGRARMGRLHADRSALPDPAPTLSIVVPAKDEAAGIRDCVTRVLAQDYPGVAVVIVDDRSTDGTGAILDAMAADDARVRPIHITHLPDGWLGKCHALFVGTEALASDWLLFVDSDVALAPDAARRAVALCEARDYDALSLMPALDCRSPLERALLPILAVAWGAAFRISLTNDDSKPEHAFANGQFFLVRRAHYARVGGHGAVRDRIVEDVALMRVLKRDGTRTRLMLGQQLARTRMHSTLRQMFHGWARIFAGSSGRSVVPMVLTVAFLLGTLAALGWGATMATTHGGHWTIAALAHVGLLVGFLAWTYRSAGQSAWHALLFPLTWPLVATILCYAIRVCGSGRVDWRGNAVRVNRG